MVDKIIRDYMEGGGRKLTVPGFGTFMRRDGGGVIFVDLLRGDDRVLAGMVEGAGPFTEVEAMARIDRFVFETRGAIERTGRATIAGFGTMTADGKGVYRFDYSPGAVPAPDEVEVGSVAADSGAADRLSDAPALDETRRVAMPAAAVSQTTVSPATAPQTQAPRTTAPPTAAPRATAPQATAPQSHRQDVRDSNARPKGGEPAADRQPRPHPQDGGSSQGRPPQGAAPRRVPSDAQRGNSADAPRRNPADAPRRRSADAPRRDAAPGRRRPSDAARKSSATDRLLVFAIIAAVIALAAMIFGLTSSASHIPFVNN